MVVVLDKNATPFTRIWCGFEQATVVQGKKLLLDFATVHEGEAQLLTEGVAASDYYASEAASYLYLIINLELFSNLFKSRL